MRVSQRSIEEVRESANIAEVASEFTALRRQGTRYSGLCPYPDHSEKTPSFSVSPDKGFYYCFGCLAADERIWTSRGLIPIAATEVGDQVIGLDGRRETITDKMFKSGSTLSIKTGAAKEGIELTPDHWCVFVKKSEAIRTVSGLHYRSSESDRTRFSSRLRNRVRSTDLSVEHASEVQVGDFWLYPVISDDDRDDALLPGQHVIKPYTKGPRNERIEGLHVNPKTAWLYGIWLAKGSLYRGGVRWCFHAKESGTLGARVVSVLEEEFGRPSTKIVRKNKNTCEVTCSSTDLSALFSFWFGYGCADKRLPVEVLSWTAGCQQALIRGYVDGDGHAHGGIISTPTVSEELAYGIFALCIQTRRVCSIRVTPERVDEDGVRHRKVYTVFQLSRESVKGFFAPIDGTTYFWSSVQEIETCREKPTPVVDITTTGSHTFLTKTGITHNCQKGGDAIKLVTDLKNLSFIEAVTYLAERSNIELEFEGASSTDARAAKERNERRRAIHRALAAAAAYYHKYLLKSQSPEAEMARAYLKDRGFRSSTIEEFRLGLAPGRGNGRFVEIARGLDIGRKVLDAAGLISPRGGERFSGRITFPISDRRGRVVGFGARSLGDEHPKYLNSPETEIFNKRDLLYGFPQVMDSMRKERAALVVEGYTDVLMLYQSGMENAVATLGTATTPGHLKILSRYVDKVYVLFDPDAAGNRAAERMVTTDSMASVAAGLQLDLRLLQLTEDPADWLREHDTEEFDALLQDAVPVLEFAIRNIAEKHHGADAMSRSRAVPEVKKLIQRIDDSVLRREALRLATQTLNVGPEVFSQPSSKPSDGHAQNTPAQPEDPHIRAGREMLALALARPDLLKRLLAVGVPVENLPGSVTLAPEDFASENQSRLFEILREDPASDPGNKVSEENDGGVLLDELGLLHAMGEKLYPSEASVRAACLRLNILGRERDKRRAEDYEEKSRIHSEIQTLKEALKSAVEQS